MNQQHTIRTHYGVSERGFRNSKETPTGGPGYGYKSTPAACLVAALYGIYKIAKGVTFCDTQKEL